MFITHLLHKLHDAGQPGPAVLPYAIYPRAPAVHPLQTAPSQYLLPPSQQPMYMQQHVQNWQLPHTQQPYMRMMSAPVPLRGPYPHSHTQAALPNVALQHQASFVPDAMQPNAISQWVREAGYALAPAPQGMSTAANPFSNHMYR